ncbi:hypothetical protein SH580_12470 [Coraliomargarita algicola]|uniref:Uncharacterized protein n=2 Tax=Coraliomargaritaceae TaxID=3056371 RepID=A0ABU1AXT8_9BACT|nr:MULTISPECIES: hypothetical protein [unclassified Coraliomargarita]MDQ8208962.1 hypothetical protein [Coraliomargarita sp. SDUM461003]WPJ94249.1 hypothetical protein SH580_12470 [Coraliomargarita sp. J2-16]
MLSSKQSKHPITRLLSGALVVLIVLLTLASSSADLHDYLHGKQNCEHACAGQDDAADDKRSNSENDTHVCAVTFLATGCSAIIPLTTPERTNQLLSTVSIEMESLWCGQAPIRLHSRAPPLSPLV